MTGNLCLADGHRIGIHTLADLHSFIGLLLIKLERLGYTARERSGIRLALIEALVNAIRHGNGNDPSKAVRVRYDASEFQFLIEIEDDGADVAGNFEPDLNARNQRERIGGRDVFLMEHYMTWVRYDENGRCVTMCRVRGA